MLKPENNLKCTKCSSIEMKFGQNPILEFGQIFSPPPLLLIIFLSLSRSLSLYFVFMSSNIHLCPYG